MIEGLEGTQESWLDVLVGLVEALVNAASIASRVVDLVGLEVIVPVDNIAGTSDSYHEIFSCWVVGNVTLSLVGELIDNCDILHSRELIAGCSTFPRLDARLRAVGDLCVFEVKLT